LQRLAAAKQIGGDKVRSAISLVVYEQDVARAIEFVFGDTLICDDADTANRVTFDPRVLTKSVTLQGDVYDPSGTMSGGSAPSGSGMLVQIQQLVQVEKEFNQARAKVASLEQEEVKVKPYRDAWKKLKSDIDLKEHELKLLVEQVEGSNASRVRSVEMSSSLLSFANALFSLDRFPSRSLQNHYRRPPGIAPDGTGQTKDGTGRDQETRERHV
jgi:structural maintenance of chromosome 2